MSKLNKVENNYVTKSLKGTILKYKTDLIVKVEKR